MPEFSGNGLELPPLLEEPPSSKKVIRYSGDISVRDIDNLTPEILKSSLLKLKKFCDKNKRTIKRLRNEQYRHIKKIHNLETLLSDLKNKELLSSNSCDVIEV